MDTMFDHTAQRTIRVRDQGEVDLVKLDQPGGQSHTLRLLQTLSLAVCRASDLTGALNQVLDDLLTLTKAETGAIHLVHDETEELRLVASRGLSERFWQTECRIPRGACLCGRSAYGDEPLVVDNLMSDPRLERPACLDERVGALVAVPFRSRGRTFGLLTLYASTPGAFAGVDRVVLRAIGLHFGSAIDNAAWGANIRDLAVADERHVIASELHDGVAQSLAYLNLQVKRVQELLKRGATDRASRELTAIQDVIQSTYDDVRQLLADFRIAPTGPGSFGTALKKQLETFELQTGVRTELSGESEAVALSFGQQAEVFRIVQEALANVRKHARASSVIVTCERADGWCRMRVTDDGAGFDLSCLGDSGGMHVGTSIIRERAARLRGRVTIESQPGHGTTVTIAVPLALDEERSTPWA
jgi:two-component system nitrate/nitrite sensor histidine kinase NarX